MDEDELKNTKAYLEIQSMIHDNDFDNDSHQLPFTMKIDFPPVMQALKDIGYSGWLTLEADEYCLDSTPETVPQKVQNLADAARKLADMMK